jgi:hypothetical protein
MTIITLATQHTTLEPLIFLDFSYIPLISLSESLPFPQPLDFVWVIMYFARPVPVCG